MARARDEQSQTGGDGSTNLQAGRDVVYNGPSYEEMRIVALDVYRANAMELRGIAEDLATARAEKLTNDFLNRLFTEKPERAERLSDPDVQNVLFEAQRDYARSGEEDLSRVLVDLLSSRVDEDARSLRTLALNEAIISAPKLTEGQRRAIAIVFILRYSRPTFAMNAEYYAANYLRPSVLPLAGELPTNNFDYQHIEYVGAGTVSISEASFGLLLRSGVSGLFSQGFVRDQLSEGLRDLVDQTRDTPVVIPLERDHARLRFNFIFEDLFDSWLADLGLEPFRDEIKNLHDSSLMADNLICEELEAHLPELSTVRKVWDESSIRNLTLTTVGIAIGHAYWQRLTGNSSPLSAWLA